MAKVGFRGVDVQMKLVADIKKKDAEKTARVVESRETSEVRPRVDIKTEVETYGSGFEGSKGTASAAQVGRSSGGAVPAGGGVLGFLMAEKGGQRPQDELRSSGGGSVKVPAFVEDPSQTKLEDLQRFKGMNLKVTVYDPDEYSSLQEANRKGDSLDSTGTLDEVKGSELVMTKNGRTAGLDTETWKVAEVEVSRGPWSSRTNGYQSIDEALLPGAPVTARMVGNKEVEGHLLGTGRDERGNGYVEVLDQAGQSQKLPVADLYDLLSPGFSFIALKHE